MPVFAQISAIVVPYFSGDSPGLNCNVTPFFSRRFSPRAESVVESLVETSAGGEI
jgi:hypothetical protein